MVVSRRRFTGSSDRIVGSEPGLIPRRNYGVSYGQAIFPQDFTVCRVFLEKRVFTGVDIASSRPSGFFGANLQYMHRKNRLFSQRQ